jgi:hypothetical protein
MSAVTQPLEKSTRRRVNRLIQDRVILDPLIRVRKSESSTVAMAGQSGKALIQRLYLYISSDNLYRNWIITELVKDDRYNLIRMRGNGP